MARLVSWRAVKWSAADFIVIPPLYFIACCHFPHISPPFFFFLVMLRSLEESFLHPSLAFFVPLCHPISSAPLCMRYFTTCKGSVRISISMPKSGCPNLKRTQTNMIIDSKMPGPWHAWCWVFVFFVSVSSPLLFCSAELFEKLWMFAIWTWNLKRYSPLSLIYSDRRGPTSKSFRDFL